MLPAVPIVVRQTVRQTVRQNMPNTCRKMRKQLENVVLGVGYSFGIQHRTNNRTNTCRTTADKCAIGGSFARKLPLLHSSILPSKSREEPCFHKENGRKNCHILLIFYSSIQIRRARLRHVFGTMCFTIRTTKTNASHCNQTI